MKGLPIACKSIGTTFETIESDTSACVIENYDSAPARTVLSTPPLFPTACRLIPRKMIAPKLFQHSEIRLNQRCQLNIRNYLAMQCMSCWNMAVRCCCWEPLIGLIPNRPYLNYHEAARDHCALIGLLDEQGACTLSNNEVACTL
jgi:hypothetical protein